jgi:hypothetical protein
MSKPQISFARHRREFKPIAGGSRQNRPSSVTTPLLFVLQAQAAATDREYQSVPLSWGLVPAIDVFFAEGVEKRESGEKRATAGKRFALRRNAIRRLFLRVCTIASRCWTRQSKLSALRLKYMQLCRAQN